jgi:hypothetical protein
MDAAFKYLLRTGIASRLVGTYLLAIPDSDLTAVEANDIVDRLAINHGSDGMSRPETFGRRTIAEAAQKRRIPSGQPHRVDKGPFGRSCRVAIVNIPPMVANNISNHVGDRCTQRL